MLGTRITAPSLKHFAYSFRKTRRQINEGKQFSDDKCDVIKQSDVGTSEGSAEGGNGSPGVSRHIQGTAMGLNENSERDRLWREQS